MRMGIDAGDRRKCSRRDCPEQRCAREAEKCPEMAQLERKVCASLWAVCEAGHRRSEVLLGVGRGPSVAARHLCSAVGQAPWETGGTGSGIPGSAPDSIASSPASAALVNSRYQHSCANGVFAAVEKGWLCRVLSVDGYSDKTRLVLKGVWLQGGTGKNSESRRICISEERSHSLGPSEVVAPAEDPRDRSGGGWGTVKPRRRLCAALCWPLGAGPPDGAGQRGLPPSAGQEARLGGDARRKEVRETPLLGRAAGPAQIPRCPLELPVLPTSPSRCQDAGVPGSRTFRDEGTGPGRGLPVSLPLPSSKQPCWGGSPVRPPPS
ncbi:hypothetical protein P7K49_017316 [Saguinus oedipus]|uniref:Uncharacterized protein n=1 Tax=Saguinus oedipus TaxID=9490 RepID=A0ABQ9V2E0_SAGOE|nr:hypothetical protein P7K49_017316 [Saguinus oedipus]